MGFSADILSVLQSYLAYVSALESGDVSSVLKRKTLEALLKFGGESEAYPAVFLYIGRIYKRDDEQKRALAAFKKAVDLDPNFSEASSSFGIFRGRLRRRRKVSCDGRSGV